jgi:hypothetical protein
MEAECVGLRLMQPYKGDLGNRYASAPCCGKHVLRWLVNSAKFNNSSTMSQLGRWITKGWICETFNGDEALMAETSHMG